MLRRAIDCITVAAKWAIVVFPIITEWVLLMHRRLLSAIVWLFGVVMWLFSAVITGVSTHMPRRCSGRVGVSVHWSYAVQNEDIVNEQRHVDVREGEQVQGVLQEGLMKRHRRLEMKEHNAPNQKAQCGSQVKNVTQEVSELTNGQKTRSARSSCSSTQAPQKINVKLMEKDLSASESYFSVTHSSSYSKVNMVARKMSSSCVQTSPVHSSGYGQSNGSDCSTSSLDSISCSVGSNASLVSSPQHNELTRTSPTGSLPSSPRHVQACRGASGLPSEQPAYSDSALAMSTCVHSHCSGNRGPFPATTSHYSEKRHNLYGPQCGDHGDVTDTCSGLVIQNSYRSGGMMRQDTDDELARALAQHLASLQLSVTVPPWYIVDTLLFEEYHHLSDGSGFSSRDEGLDVTQDVLIASHPCQNVPVEDDVDIVNSDEARSVHRRLPDGRLVKEETCASVQPVIIPTSLSQVKKDVLESGAITLLGNKDIRGGAVILISCCNNVWEDEHSSAVHLAHLMLYLIHLPRESTRQRGVTVLVEARGTTLKTLNLLLETLYIVEATDQLGIYIVHVMADRLVQTLLFRTPVFRPKVKLKINLVTSADTLRRFIAKDLLPKEMGGKVIHNHSKLIERLQNLDHFIQRCRQAAHLLLSVIRDLHQQVAPPRSTQELQDLMVWQRECAQRALKDETLHRVQQEGEQELERLRKEQEYVYSDLYDRAVTLYTNVKDSALELARLAEQRLQQLDHWMYIKKSEQSLTELLSWFCDDGETILKRYEQPSDSLHAIRAQKAQLEKDSQVLKTHLDRAKSLHQEAAMLVQSDELDHVTGIRETSKELQVKAAKFSERMLHAQEVIHNMATCIELLDKCYDWAVQTTQIAASTDTCVHDVQSLEDYLARISAYLKDHPPLTLDTFREIESLAVELDNDKLRDRCAVARNRCLEAEHLVHQRQVMLSRARDSVLSEESQDSFSTEETPCSSKPPSGLLSISPVYSAGSCSYGPVVYRDQGRPIWEYRHCSTPVTNSMGNVVRRRSYAGKPSVPVYSSSVAAFKENLYGMDISEYEEQLFNEGLITEDMSDRIVTSLPKGLSDSTLRGSRESLRSSAENLADTTDTARPKSPSTVSSVLNISLNRHGRPVRKMKRVASCIIPDRALEGLDCEGHFERPLSMLTAAPSTDSLPSLPEDDTLDTSARSERRRGWTPLPVTSKELAQRSHNPLYNQSMSDLRVAEDDIQKRKQLQLVMRELLETEREYVRSLRFIIEHYMPELNTETVPQPLRGKRNVIFGNLEKIYDFHSTHFLRELEPCSGNPFAIGHCFLHHAAEFYLYALYNKNKPRSDNLMREHGCNFFRKKQRELGEKMDLSSYLLKPVQRIGKYALLLKQVLKLCPYSDPDFPVLKEAADMVKFQLRHGNDLLALDCLVGSDVNLQEQGMLLRQDTFMVYHGRRKAMRHVFLFEELVVFSKAKRNSQGQDVYSYKNSLKTSDLGLTENVSDNQYKFEIWFRKRTGNDTYTLQASSMEIKAEWIREISRLLWKQAIKNREFRRAEAAQMGSGSKPCIDLKPSKDNIHDRFVNIHLSNRVPKARSSLAVGSVDYQRQGGKRPHSLISLSSTSSSSSSGLHPTATLSITFESPLEQSVQVTSRRVSQEIPKTNCLSSPMEDATTQTTLRRGAKLFSSSSTTDISAPSKDPRRLSLLEMDHNDLIKTSDL